jgi:hypothetical protein
VRLIALASPCAPFSTGRAEAAVAAAGAIRLKMRLTRVIVLRVLGQMFLDNIKQTSFDK